MPLLSHILTAINELAPWDLAESWDNVGLQVGNKETPVQKVLIALDFNQKVLAEGLEHGVNGFIVHHPLIFKPLNQITTDSTVGNSIKNLLKQDLFLIAAHTNIDKAKQGLNQYLAELFNLNNIKSIDSVKSYDYKVIVFAPENHVDILRKNMTQAGAGIIGDYAECSFELTGTGTFRPGINARPFIGESGVFQRTPEIRLEMRTEKNRLAQVLQAIAKFHPYEEPAIDVIPLFNHSNHGLGRIGNLKRSVSLAEFCQMVKEKLATKELRITGDLSRPVKQVALCSGSGHDLLNDSIRLQADVFLTGELGYHDYLTAQDNGLAVVTTGHFTSEKCFRPLLADYLKSYFNSETGFEVIESQIQEEPYLTLEEEVTTGE